jgi:hypothetical protein
MERVSTTHLLTMEQAKGNAKLLIPKPSEKRPCRYDLQQIYKKNAIFRSRKKDKAEKKPRKKMP